MARSSAAARPLTEHDEIRRWAEERDSRPSRVRGTGVGEDVGMIRLDFPGYSGGESLEEISWDEWFEQFDERNLALMVQDETPGGETSNFNRLVSRDTAEEAEKESEAETGSATERAAVSRSKRARARAEGRARGTQGKSRTRSKSQSGSAKSAGGLRSSVSSGRSSRSSRSAA
ncbi:MAG TPA: hypothetical protein VGV15_06175, partial [Terriglobales bacterium]|nr:hypothetical protein [Terriglobales bacterium]